MRVLKLPSGLWRLSAAHMLTASEGLACVAKHGVDIHKVSARQHWHMRRRTRQQSDIRDREGERSREGDLRVAVAVGGRGRGGGATVWHHVRLLQQPSLSPIGADALNQLTRPQWIQATMDSLIAWRWR